MPGPVAQAYSHTGALDVPCDHCGAQVGSYCTDPATGRLRRIPCVTRCGRPCRDNTVGVGSTDEHPDPYPAVTISAPTIPDGPTYVDITRPRYPRQDD